MKSNHNIIIYIYNIKYDPIIVMVLKVQKVHMEMCVYSCGLLIQKLLYRDYS